MDYHTCGQLLRWVDVLPRGTSNDGGIFRGGNDRGTVASPKPLPWPCCPAPGSHNGQPWRGGGAFMRPAKLLNIVGVIKEVWK